MIITDETRKFWEERSAVILDAYAKGLLDDKDPIDKAEIEWAKESTEVKEAALLRLEAIQDRWQSETDTMCESHNEN